MRTALAIVGLCLALSAGADQAAPQDGPSALIQDMAQAYAAVEGYALIFHKQERIDGKLQSEEVILLKFQKPLKVYMKWIRGPHQGREALYVEGWNKNRIRIHEPGVLSFLVLNLDPHGRLARRGHRHPITEAGFGKLVEILQDNVEKGLRAGVLEFQDLGEVEVYSRRTRHVELKYSCGEGQGYYCRRAVLHVDVENKLPVKVEVYDWDDALVEQYGFENIDLAAGLTEADFDPRNPGYKF